MSDIKPELIEKSAQALSDMRARRSWAFHEIGQPLRDTVYDDERRADARAALEAVADDLRAEGVVKALRSAIEELERLDDGRTTGYHSAGRHIIARLRARAELIEAGSDDE